MYFIIHGIKLPIRKYLMVLHRHLRKSAQSFTVTSDKDVW